MMHRLGVMSMAYDLWAPCSTSDCRTKDVAIERSLPLQRLRRVLAGETMCHATEGCALSLPAVSPG